METCKETTTSRKSTEACGCVLRFACCVLRVAVSMCTCTTVRAEVCACMSVFMCGVRRVANEMEMGVSGWQ